MYQEGVEVIFACGGSVGKSVMSAATESEAKVIGVDVDQRYDSETVITSATKGLGASVVSVRDAIYTDKWATFSGITTTFNAANGGVGLPTVVIGDEAGNAFDRFSTFDKAAYDVVFAELAAGNISLLRTITVVDASGAATAEELSAALILVYNCRHYNHRTSLLPSPVFWPLRRRLYPLPVRNNQSHSYHNSSGQNLLRILH